MNNTATVDNSVRGVIGDDNTFGDNASLFNNNAKTLISQGTEAAPAEKVAQDFVEKSIANLNINNKADVDNSVETLIGDRNVFGDNASIGNNNAQTAIIQGLNAGRGIELGRGFSEDSGLNLGRRGEAQERARNWLGFLGY